MNAEQFTKIAIELSSLGKNKEAYKNFVIVTQLLPNDSGAWLNLGICCIAIEDIQTASNAFEEAIKLEPCCIPAYSNLASIWVSRLKPEVAITVLDNGLRVNENNPTLLATKGALLAQIGEVQQAIGLLSKAHELASNDFSIALIFSELLVQQQRFSKALLLLTKEWPKDRFLSRFYLALGRAQYGCRNIEAAQTAIINARNAGANEATNLLIQLSRGWGNPIESKRILMQPLRTIHAQYMFDLQNDFEEFMHYNPQGIISSNIASIEREILKRYEFPTLPPKELAWIVFHIANGSMEFIGLCQLVDIDHKNQKAELLMMMKDRGKGFGVEALLMVANEYFRNYGFNKLVSLVLDTNTVVLDMELRLGFTQEGYLQRHIIEKKSNKFIGIHQLAIFKDNFDESNIISKLKKRFKIL